MTTRILPVAEWPQLDGTDLGVVCAQLDPTRTQILVVEDGGAIVGCWALLQIGRAEGVWVHPDYRGKASVARKLWIGMARLASSLGLSIVETGAGSPAIAELLERHGARKVPMESYFLPLQGVR